MDSRVDCMACLVAFPDEEDDEGRVFPRGVVVNTGITHGLAKTNYGEIQRRCDFYSDGRARSNRYWWVEVKDIVP